MSSINLSISQLFSYAQSSAQQPSEVVDDFIAEEEVDAPKQVDEFAEKKLTQYIANYNQTFNTNYSLGSGFYDYYQILVVELRPTVQIKIRVRN